MLIISLLLLFIRCNSEVPETMPPEDSKPKTIAINNTNSSMPSTGTITSQYSDSPENEDIDKLVDNNLQTKFSTKHAKVWILWKNSVPVIVSEYFLISANNASEKDPKSWTLSASSDDNTWSTLHTVSKESFASRGLKKAYDFSNKQAYLYYKLSITANNGASQIQLAEWGLKEGDQNMEDLMVFATGFTHSEQTPMGNHYENRHVTTTDDKAWLENAENEPSLPKKPKNLQWRKLSISLYPFGYPSPADINQHSIGDCGGIAAMASMAYVHPDFVKSIIKDNGNQTYSISMFDPQGKPIKVNITSLLLVDAAGKIASVSSKNDKACWSSLLEKAIMKYNAVYKVNPEIEGIGSEHVIPLFTGNGDSFAFEPGKLSASQLQRAVKVALFQGKMIIGGFNKELIIGDLKTITRHAYTIMLSKDTHALFAMRNPWGSSPGENGSLDGVINIPSSENITSTIDLRIVDSGKAGNNGIKQPYIPPLSTFQGHKVRIDSSLMKSGM